jgi:streptogramin lyase
MLSLQSTLCKRLVFALSLVALFGCSVQREALVPSASQSSSRARTIISTVRAGDTDYTIEEMYTPSSENVLAIAPGPESRVWFTGSYVGTSSYAGQMLALPISDVSYALVEGPDGAEWLTSYSTDSVERISKYGNLIRFPVPKNFGDAGNAPIVSANGDLWIATAGDAPSLVRVTTAGKMNAYKLPSGSKPVSLAYSGGDFWLTDAATNAIRRVTPTGSVTTFAVPTGNAGLTGICSAPNGTSWFLEYSADKLGSITSAGAFHEYPIPSAYSEPNDCVAGPDGAIWFTESIGKLGRATTSGSITELPLSGPQADARGIDVADGNIWFTEQQAEGIIGQVELHAVKNSQPKYLSFTLTLAKASQLGVPEKIALKVEVKDLRGRVITGTYPYPIHLTTSDARQARLTTNVLTSSTQPVAVVFSGRYTDATIAANAQGGGTSYSATLLPFTPPEKRLPAPAFNVIVGKQKSLWMCLSDGSIATRSASGILHDYGGSNYFEVEGCSMAEGADGNVWFPDYANDRIGKITPQGKLTYIDLEHDASPLAIAAGSDGALWFTEDFPDKIGRVTTAGQVTTFNAKFGAYDIVAGPDGNLWFDDHKGNIWKMTTSGTMTLVRRQATTGSLWSIGTGIWFVASGYPSPLDELSPEGKIEKSYPLPIVCFPTALTGSPGGTLWYVDEEHNCVARLASSGLVDIVPTYSRKENSEVYGGIVFGPNNDVWFTESGNSGLGWLDPKTM